MNNSGTPSHCKPTDRACLNPVIIAKFAAPYGVRGWVKLITYTETPEHFLRYQHYWMQQKDCWQPIVIEAHQCTNQQLRVKLQQYDDREHAATLTHRGIAIARHELPPLAKGTYYWVDLIGLTVINQRQQQLGHIDHLFATGANDVIVVKQKQGAECLLPYISSVVKSVDLKKGKMYVEWE